MLEAFERAGYLAAPFSSMADVYVINTCTVTGTGDKKSRQMIRRAHKTNPDAAIVVTGCMAQRVAEGLLLPGVRLVLGTQRRAEIVTLLEKALAREAPRIAVEPLLSAPFESLRVTGSEGRTRAALKVQEGCENRCTYCVIPSVRGKIRSRPLPEIKEEAARLADAGYREIVITGIHLSSYGRDFGDGTGLLDALAAAHGAEGIARIRLGSLEPGIVTEGFVKAAYGMPKICPQFMLALQSGSDAVLARMGRRYNTSQYAAAVERVRAVFPDAAITTDVMTGFPGETEAEFEQTLAFVERTGFARIHVFPYSKREGTKAAAMPGQVAKAAREARAAALIALGAKLEEAYIGRWRGRTAEVLFEEALAGGNAAGYTREYVRVVADGKPGELSEVLLERTRRDHAVGRRAR